MKALRVMMAAALVALIATYPVAGANVVIKLATVVPDGSLWDKVLRQLTSDWRKQTEGRVQVTVFAGGIQGSEQAIIQRMHFNQLQAASFTAIGLAEIDDAFNVFGIPLFYESYDELVYVRDKLTPMLQTRLAAKRFVLVNWGQGGWVHVFSKKPVKTLADLRELKLFTSAGEDRMVQWYKDNGFRPVPLAINDMMTSLQTGMVEAIPVTPLSALAFQWYQHTPYMMDLGLAPLVGATVVTQRAWERIGESDRAKMLEAAAAAERRLDRDVPKQDQEAVAAMKARRLTVTGTEEDEWRQRADEFARTMRGTLVPPDIFDLALRERDAYRQAHGGSR